MERSDGEKVSVRVCYCTTRRLEHIRVCSCVLVCSVMVGIGRKCKSCYWNKEKTRDPSE